MLAPFRPEMTTLLRCTIVALVVVAGIAFLAVCGDGLFGVCGHTCCTGIDRSRALHRIARRLRCACESALSHALLLFAVGVATFAAAFDGLASGPTLQKVSSLRI